jgi:hypothetical protein
MVTFVRINAMTSLRICCCSGVWMAALLTAHEAGRRPTDAEIAQYRQCDVVEEYSGSCAGCCDPDPESMSLRVIPREV